MGGWCFTSQASLIAMAKCRDLECVCLCVWVFFQWARLIISARYLQEEVLLSLCKRLCCVESERVYWSMYDSIYKWVSADTKMWPYRFESSLATRGMCGILREGRSFHGWSQALVCLFVCPSNILWELSFWVCCVVWCCFQCVRQFMVGTLRDCWEHPSHWARAETQMKRGD